MGDYSVKGTWDYQVGEDNMWEECNYIFKCEGHRQRFVITQATTNLHAWHLMLMNDIRFEVKDSWRPPAVVSNEHVRQMINTVARQGADELNNRAPPTGPAASQLPGGEPRTEVFQVTSLQRLKNERNEDANAAIVEIDTDANSPYYPNQLALFEIYPPKKL
ncbi:MAG: hypothetical protein OHK93_001145 [Ramalina farinacea]|uniref:Uncharacterized protein n=1 Tax=Ramalina farinacea TaxID=258253 RepID=A0AA43TSK4_9LECA|nr:hypothetical protein [Ramalina farinacea]